MTFIRKRKHGIYYYYWRDSNGKQKAKSLTVRRKRQAQKLKEKLDMEYAEKRLGVSPKKSAEITEYLDQYLKWSYEAKSKNWARREKSIIKHWKKFFADRPETYLEEINLESVKKYYKSRKNEVSGKTLGMEIGLVKRVLKQAKEGNYKVQEINWSPIKKIITHKAEKHFDYFTREQIEKIFNSGLDHINYYKVLFYTGLRSADAGNLHSKNINSEKKVIEIRHTQKTKATAIIPIHPEISFVSDVKNGYIFPIMRDYKGRRKARNDLQDFCQSENWDGYFALHSFRHSFNQHLAMNDVDFNSRKTFLTHSSGKSTADYTHFNLEKAREMIEKL